MEATQGRERILLIGPWGSGKSFSWCKIADWERKRGTGKVYIIDTDMAVERMAVNFGDEFMENVEFVDAFDWPEYNQSVDAYRSKATSNDWLVVDLIDKAWESVQAYFTDQVFHKGIDDYFLQARKASGEKGSSGSPLDGWTDWSVINKMYQSWIMKVLRFPGHVLVCAPAEPIQAASDSKETLETFGRYGVKPKGQKNLGHQFHTVLLMGTKKDGYVMTSIKDRSRELMKGEENKDFVLNYLVAKGGWKL